MDRHSTFQYGPRAEAAPTFVPHTCTQFELGVASDIQDIGGTYNLNLRLTTQRGVFVIRVHRPWVTLERLTQLHATRRRLALRGLPITVPLPTKNGATIVKYDGRLVEVEAFAAHEGTVDSWGRYRLAMWMLGHLHTSLAAEIEPTTFIPPRIRNYGTPLELHRWTEHTEQCIRAEPPSNLTDEALNLCQQARNILLPMVDWWNHAGIHLPRQICHGDYGGENILIANDEIVAILDFDFLSIHERVFDIAYCLYWAYCKRMSTVAPEQWAWKRISTFLGDYESTAGAPLTEAERRALLMTMARVPLYWIGEAGFMPNVTRNVVSLAGYVRNAQWIFDHIETIEQQFDSGS